MMQNGSVDRVYQNQSLVLQGSPEKSSVLGKGAQLDKSDLQHLEGNAANSKYNYGNNPSY